MENNTVHMTARYKHKFNVKNSYIHHGTMTSYDPILSTVNNSIFTDIKTTLLYTQCHNQITVNYLSL